MESPAVAAAELAAMHEVQRFMLSALRAALASRERTPALQMLLLGLREQISHWRAQRLTLGAQPGLADAAAKEAHAAFRNTFDTHMRNVEALLDELER